MRREIGSEFWDVHISCKKNNLFPEFTNWFLSGRSALKSIISELEGCHTVSMPSWCCDSMIKPFIDAGFSVNFYPVYWDRGLIQEVDYNSDVLFLMDYFGYSSNSLKMNSYQGVIIRDITHSLFSTTYSDAHYYFGSLRKWCGVWTGGYAWTCDGHKLGIGVPDDSEFINLRTQAMKMKKEYVEGLNDDKKYLNVFEQAEKCLETVEVSPAAERDMFLGQHLDVELIRNRRRANADVLRSAFSDWLIISELKTTDTPMFVPVLVPNGKRNSLRYHLISNGIYCPIHWPISEFHKLNKNTADIFQNEISLVCDQRYNEEDMVRMVKVIRDYLEE